LERATGTTRKFLFEKNKLSTFWKPRSLQSFSKVLTKIAIAGAVAGAGYLTYHCYSPTSQLYGRTLARAANPAHLALTYDDGPNDQHTERLLEVLAHYQVTATFFLVGRFVSARPQIARAVVAAGHLIGNHTVTHANLLLLSRQRIVTELSECSRIIFDVTGVHPRYFRPPFGARRPGVLSAARELGLVPVMWDVTCYDWRATSADAVENYARRRIDRDRARGHIILLHDGGHTGLGANRSHTVIATERLIQRYKGEYEFRTVDQI
jgi:peptidoglycan-N-acetylglucosamine deacetylase